MAIASKTFRLFVSSTFSDLKEERNALHRAVFPSLKKLCEEDGFRFQAIDLRWGVREEAGLDQRTMQICLDEVKRCQDVTPKPNFLILLGDKYGWRPLPAEIPADEWQQIEERLRAQGKEGARRLERLTEWYKLDLNARPNAKCPGVWILRPRTKEEWGTPKYEKHTVWEEEVERPLREILVQTTTGLGLAEDAHLKYWASATEQEIDRGALRAKDAPEHVFCIFREILRLPENATADGFRDLVPDYGPGNAANLLVPDMDANRLLEALKARLRRTLPERNFLSSKADWLDLPEELSAQEWVKAHQQLAEEVEKLEQGDDLEEDEKRELLAALKDLQELVSKWYHPVGDEREEPVVHSYRRSQAFQSLDDRERIKLERSLRRAVFHERRPPISISHLRQFCEDVERVLSEVIRSQIEKFKEEDEKTGDLDKEIEQHKTFYEDRTKFFHGRAATLCRFADYLAANDDPHPLALIGEPGSGKTSVLAKAVEEAQRTQPEATVIFRFIGWTPSSAVVRDLLDKLCRQLAPLYGGKQETPNEYRELVQELPKRLKQAGERKRVLMFLDALDQLSEADSARNLTWLPMELPPNVRLVVSTSTEPGDAAAVLRRRLPKASGNPTGGWFTLDDMPVEEADALFRMWFDDADRTLQGYANALQNGGGQWKYVLDRFSGCRRPLYLKLAFEEARRWRSFDATTDTELTADISSLIEQLYGRLSSPRNHGATIVSRSVGYLVAAKNGLTEDEVIDVLSQDEEVLKEVKKLHRIPEEKLPVVIWSRFRFELEPYLTQRSADGTSLLAFYHPQLHRVAQQKYLEPYKAVRHRKLAEFFEKQVLFWGESEQKKANIRKLSELPYQQTYACDDTNAGDDMWSKLSTTLTDFRFVHAKVEHGMPYELVDDYERANAQLPALASRWEDPFQEIRTKLREFSSAVNQEFHAFFKRPRATAQQIYNNLYARSSSDGAVGDVLRTYVERMAYPGGGSWLRRLNAAPNTSTSRALVRTLAGHDGSVTALAVSPTGSRIASGGIDGTLRVWQVKNGAVLEEFLAHEGGVTALHWCPDDPDEARVISAGRDQAIREWDWRSEREIRSWRAHISRIRDLVSVSDHGWIVSCGDDRTLRVWDSPTKRETRTLYGHLDRVFCLATDRRGSVVVSGSDDATLKMWNIEGTREPTTLRGHVDSVRCVAVDAEGNWAVSGGDDLALKVWNLHTGREHRTVRDAHQQRITCVGIVRGDVDRSRSDPVDDEQVPALQCVSGSNDCTLKLWDLNTGEEIATLRGHTGGINVLAADPGAKWFASGAEDGTVRIWDTILPRMNIEGSIEHRARITSIAYQDGIGMLASGSDDGTIRLWDGRGPGAHLLTLRGHHGAVMCVAFLNDKRIVSGSSDCTLRVWDAADGKWLHTLGGPLSAFADEIEKEASKEQLSALQALLGTAGGHKNAVTCVAPAGGNRVVSGGKDRTVRLWDVEKGQELSVFTGAAPNIVIEKVVVSLPLNLVVTAGPTPAIHVWDLARGGEPRQLEGHTSGVTCLGLVTDDLLVSGSRDRTVRLWDVTTGEQRRLLSDHLDWVTCIAVNSELGVIASGSCDGTVRVWDLFAGNSIHRLVGHGGPVRGVSIIGASRQIISYGDDERVIVWDLSSGHHIVEADVGVPVSAMVSLSPDKICLGTKWGGLVLLRVDA